MGSKEKKDFKSRLENYWYYYKIHTLFGVFAVFVAVLIVVSCSRSDKPVLLTAVDATAALGADDTENLLEAFADSAGIDEDSVIYRNTADYVSERVAEQTGAKSLVGSMKYGDIEAVFTVRGYEFVEDCVGNIEDVLPKELIDELGADVMAGYLEENVNGLEETDDMAGIIVNDAKRFKETYGELKETIVLQIPSGCKNREQAEAFVRYLFDIK